MGSRLCYAQQSPPPSQEQISNHNQFPSDEFILKHNAVNNNVIEDISSVDKRRAVFVSFVGLFSTWRNCPSVVLYSSIFIIPLKEEWLYTPQKYIADIKACMPGNYALFYEDKEFVELLKWKNSQGLVFWTMNDFENMPESSDNNLMCPFWIDFNQRLQKLYDPITGGTYKPIPFKKQWWRDNYVSKFEIELSAILCELYFVRESRKFKAIKEIIHQSNPKSLYPVVSYSEHEWEWGHTCLGSIKKLSSEKLLTIDECSAESDGGHWCIVDEDCISPNTPRSIDEEDMFESNDVNV